MEPSYPVITICGSMRYYEEMLRQAERLTVLGWVVLMPFSTEKETVTKEMLDDMHRQKIAMSQAIMVVGEHRGTSTLGEITYAESLGLEWYDWRCDSSFLVVDIHGR